MPNRDPSGPGVGPASRVGLRPFPCSGHLIDSRKLEDMGLLAFTKAHGAGNDFLIVKRDDTSSLGLRAGDMPELAVRMCSRRFGIGADGLEVVGSPRSSKTLASAHLWNSDGSEAEISGNGTRCVAAYLTDGWGAPARFVIETGAGAREVERVRRAHPEYEFRMTSDESTCRVLDDALVVEALGTRHRVVEVDVGNPQCVYRVDSFGFDWEKVGAALERHGHFPNGSNVSFVRVGPVHGGRGLIEVRFWERGAGATLSSGTGSLGAAVAARHLGWVRNGVTIRTEGGDLTVDWQDGVRLTGPACIVARGRYEVGATSSGRGF